MESPLVFVDAWNVIRSRWPNMREEPFLELCQRWAAQEGVHAMVVFDGDAPGDRIGVWEVDERTRMAGTGGGTADDWIAQYAEKYAAEGRRLWVVTSDRELRRRVEPYVERIIGGGSFAGELERLQRGG
jgi:predicted RNA-binding protein with PIN domain